jgi:hypothetical protein
MTNSQGGRDPPEAGGRVSCFASLVRTRRGKKQVDLGQVTGEHRNCPMEYIKLYTLILVNI